MQKRGEIMAIAGSLTYDTKIDKSGFENGLKGITNSVKSGGTKIKDIVSALGITKIIGKAIGIINNSIDGAVSRIDTLNNFPKVMSNLGIASEDSEKAVKKLSGGLQGIPTTLDDASLAVQRFTSKNGDVNKSVDLFLAVNNALLAGGASADIQSTAMEQLSQAYAKGKPDMVEWKSLQTAMPAQLKQVAQAFNMTSDELGEALRSGKISMDDFMDKIIELNKNGTGEFKSFEEQAKNSTGGIKTSITNAKTAITRGVAKIIEAFDKALKSNGLGGISTVISNIGTVGENALKKISELIPKLVENIGQIIPALATVVIGFNLLDGKSIIGFGDTVENVFSLISKKAGFLSEILSKGLGFGALAGLAFVALGLLQDNFGEQINQIATVAIEQGPTIVTNLVNGIVSALPKLIEQGSQLLQTLLNVIITNLPAIIEGGMRIISALVAGLAQQLPRIIPMAIQLILTIVNALIENLPMIIEAGLQLLIGLIQGIISAIPHLIEMLPTIITTICEAITQSLPMIIEAGITILISLIEGIVNTIPKLIEILPQIITTIITFITENIPTIIEAGVEILIALIDGVIEAIPKLIEMLPQIITTIVQILVQNFPKIVEAGGKIVSSLISGIGLLLGKLGEIIGMIVQIIWNKLVECWNNLIIGFQNLGTKIWEVLVNAWNNIVAFFTETIPQWIQNVIDWFANLPYQIGYQIGELLGKILQFGIDVWNWITTELPQIIQNIINWFAELPGRIWEWLCNVVSNIITWGQNMWNTATTAVSNMINGVINWFSQLPGRIWTWLVNTVTNIINWGKDMANKGKEGAKDLFDNIVNVVKELPGKMLEIGKNIVEGIWNGITGMGSWIAGKVSGFFSGIVDGAKKSLGIQSPSRVFRDKVGKFIPQGIAVGIEADTDKALKAIDNMNNDIMSKMQNAVAIETDSINASAILQANKEQPIVIARDHTTTINNTQQFYSKNATPYEEQKQAKQQLRRLAYGL